MDINKVTLIGRLTRDPEKRSVPSGQQLASFSVATNHVWRDVRTKAKHDRTEFHRVIAWGKLAEIVLSYLQKASRVYVEGRLQYRDWTDAKGQKRSATDIIADEIIMLSPNSKQRTTSDTAFAKEEPGEKELVVEEVS